MKEDGGRVHSGCLGGIGMSTRYLQNISRVVQGATGQDGTQCRCTMPKNGPLQYSAMRWLVGQDRQEVNIIAAEDGVALDYYNEYELMVVQIHWEMSET